MSSAEAPRIERPKHPLYALATFELRDYRCQLETAIAPLDLVSPARGGLQTALDDVLAEQESRRRLADA